MAGLGRFLGKQVGKEELWTGDMAKQQVVAGSGWQVKDKCWECGDSKGVHTQVCWRSLVMLPSLDWSLPLLQPCVSQLLTLKPNWRQWKSQDPSDGCTAWPSDWGCNSPAAAAPFCCDPNASLFSLQQGEPERWWWSGLFRNGNGWISWN